MRENLQNKDNLEEHIRTHTNLDNFICERCWIYFSVQVELLFLVLIVPLTSRFPCPYNSFSRYLPILWKARWSDLLSKQTLATPRPSVKNSARKKQAILKTFIKLKRGHGSMHLKSWSIVTLHLVLTRRF